MEKFLRTSPIAIILTDTFGSIQEYNSKAEYYFGRKLANTIQDLIPPNSQLDIPEIIERPFATIYEGYFTNQQGGVFFANLSVSQNEEQICWFITERQAFLDLQNTLSRHQNSPYEFQHEMSNLLSIIISAAELIAMDTNDKQILEDVGSILHASNRTMSRIRVFSMFNQTLIKKKSLLSLKEFLKENESLFVDTIGNKNHLIFPDLENDISIYVPETSFRSLLITICIHLRLSKKEATYQFHISEEKLFPPFSFHSLGLATGRAYTISIIEKGFPFTEEILTSSKYIQPSKEATLGQAWETSLYCGGSFLQRISPNGRRCVTIYLPNIV